MADSSAGTAADTVAGRAADTVAGKAADTFVERVVGTAAAFPSALRESAGNSAAFDAVDKPAQCTIARARRRATQKE